MAVARLSLVDFRSYRDASVAALPNLVVLTGENGAGKTNVLEALSLLSPGRGLRGSALSEMARDDGPGGFAIAARLADGTDIGTGTAPAAPDRRQDKWGSSRGQRYGRVAVIALADTSDGPLVHRLSERTATLSRSARIGARAGSCAASGALRSRNARAQ